MTSSDDSPRHRAGGGGRATAFVLALLFLATHASVAHAQASAADLESARGIRREAWALREKGEVRPALEKFKAAHALAHTAITGLDLAQTHAQLGELVEARDVALSVVRLPIDPEEGQKSKDARAEAARLADALRPRIPALTLTIAPAEPGPLVVTIDATPLPAAALGQPRRLNPGAHSVVARRGDDAPVEAQLTLAEGEERRLEVAVPVDGAPNANANAPVAAPVASTPVGAPASVVVLAATERNPAPSIIAWSVAGATLVTGAIIAGAASSRASDLELACPNKACPPMEWSQLDNTRTLATTADVFFIVSAVAATTGVVLWFAGPKKAAAPTVGIAPAGPGFGFGGRVLRAPRKLEALTFVVLSTVACNAVLGLDGFAKVDDDSGMGSLSETGPLPNVDADADADASAQPDGSIEVVVRRRAWPRWKIVNGPRDAGAYELVSDGGARDRTTGLTWKREALPATSLVAASAACRAFGPGWTVPTRIELLSLVDATRRTPALEPETFPDTPASPFWTTSRFVSSTTDMWTISFQTGAAGRDLGQYVRCVLPTETSP